MSKKKRQPNLPTEKQVEMESASSSEHAVHLKPQAIPRVVSLLVLMVVLVLFGSLFFEVMRDFISPLFLAGVLAVIFEPLHKWYLSRLGDRRYLASISTTTTIVLLVFLPMAWLSFQAAREITPLIGKLVPDTAEETETFVKSTGEAREKVEEFIAENFNLTVDLEKHLHDFGAKLGGVLTEYSFESLAAAVGVLVGVSVMAFALYYFLADGPVMIEALMRLSPMDDDYERELLERFAEVSRAVVVATLLSAIAQGLLAGVGYYFALPAGSPIFLLTVATMLLSIVPFIGAMAVWAPVALGVFCLLGETGVDGEFVHTGFWPGLLLGIYGFTIVSSADNLIKPWVLHGQSNLHPLLALLSVLGGVSALGAIGILVGPMLVAFLQTLLDMLRKELDHFGDPQAS